MSAMVKINFFDANLWAVSVSLWGLLKGFVKFVARLLVVLHRGIDINCTSSSKMGELTKRVRGLCVDPQILQFVLKPICEIQND